MLFTTFSTRKENSDFRVLHLIGDWIHLTFAFSRPIPRNITIHMERSKTKRAVVTTGFRSFGNLFSTLMTDKVFINRLHWDKTMNIKKFPLNKTDQLLLGNLQSYKYFLQSFFCENPLDPESKQITNDQSANIDYFSDEYFLVV